MQKYFTSKYLLAFQSLKISVFLQQENDFGYFILKMTSLLNCHGIRLLSKRFSNLREVAIVIIFVLDLAGVVDESKCSLFIIKNPLEPLFCSVHHPGVLDDLVNVGVLLSDWIVPNSVSEQSIVTKCAEIQTYDILCLFSSTI